MEEAVADAQSPFRVTMKVQETSPKGIADGVTFCMQRSLENSSRKSEG